MKSELTCIYKNLKGLMEDEENYYLVRGQIEMLDLIIQRMPEDKEG